MTGPEWTPVAVAKRRTRSWPWTRWGGAVGLLLPLAAGIALWAVIVAGVAAPLGDALARLDATSSPPSAAREDGVASHTAVAVTPTRP